MIDSTPPPTAPPTDLPFLVAALAAPPAWVAGLHGDDDEWLRLLHLTIDGLAAPAVSLLSGAAPVDALADDA